MRSAYKGNKLKCLPVQTIDTHKGLILKRGTIEVLISGDQVKQSITTLLEATSGAGATVDEIHRCFPRTARKRVDAMIRNMVARRLLVAISDDYKIPTSSENQLDVFYWHFDSTPSEVNDQLNAMPLTIVGVNTVSRQLALSLAASGHTSFRIIDHPEHRNRSLFNVDGSLQKGAWPSTVAKPEAWREKGDIGTVRCLIATSDFGGQEMLAHWNSVCLREKIHFLPVLLRNMVGYVGPFVIPGETACYECVLSRQRSHSMIPELEDLADRHASQGQFVVGLHPAMSAVLGNVAAFEVTRFYGERLPGRTAHRLLEVNLLGGYMKARPVLKIPRCSACSSLHTSSETSLTRLLFPDEADRNPDLRKGL